MCHILVEWDHSKSNNTNHSPTITFNRQTYNRLELIESDDLPSLDQLANLDANTRKRFALGCVDFALQSKKRLNRHGIHKDYKLWFSLLEL
jgi:hypothetical protein